MITIDERVYETGKTFTAPLSPVSTVTYTASQGKSPINISLVNPEGEIVPLGALRGHLETEKIRLKGYVAIRFESAAVFGLQLVVEHVKGEPVSDLPLLAPVAHNHQPTHEERTRFAVMRTLQQIGVMPDEDDLAALEADLNFRFDQDDFDDGEYMEPPEPEAPVQGSQGEPQAQSPVTEPAAPPAEPTPPTPASGGGDDDDVQ